MKDRIKRKPVIIWTVVILIVVIIIVTAAVALNLRKSTSSDTVTEDVKATTVDISQTVTAAGEIVTSEEKKISFSTSKAFKAMCVEENEKVRKGQHIIAYKNGTYEDAPASGYITAINEPSAGSTASSSNFVTFAYEKKLRLDITVPESEVNEIAKGDTADISVGSDGSMVYKGKIVSIKAISTTQLSSDSDSSDDSSESTGSSKSSKSGWSMPGKSGSGSSPFGSDSATAYYTVSISLKNVGKLRPGMSAICTITKSEKKGVTAVPVEVVRFDSDGKAYVVTVSGNKTQTVNVKTGVSDAEYVEIKKGLSGGETVRIERKEYA